MLVCSVVLRPPRGTLAAAINEAAFAIDAPTPGAIFAILADDNASAIDRLDAFNGQMMVEAASAVDVVNAGSIRNAAVVEQANALATTYWPGTYALAIVEPTTAGATQSGALAGVGGVVAGTVTETASAADFLIVPLVVTSGMGVVLDGTFVDPRSSSSLLGTDILDSGPVIVLAAGGSFEGGTDPITPASGIPLVPPGGAIDGGAGTWTVPADWTNASNSIECIGGGAGGIGNPFTWSAGGPGGGGGAYSKISNVTLTPGAVINFHIGEGGAWNASGGDTWWNTTGTVYAQGGQGQTGGQASAGIGTVKYSGGNGGVPVLQPPGGGPYHAPYAAGGGGGAAGPNGAGANGGDGVGLYGMNGGGGGGSGGGSPGGVSGEPNGYPGYGGAGGNNYLGAGGGAGGTGANAATVHGVAGKNGGGGGGGTFYSPDGYIGWLGNGGQGGSGREWGKNIGAGGGGGASSPYSNGGHGGYYGGGGGGVASGLNEIPSQGGAGASGIIIIRYNP